MTTEAIPDGIYILSSEGSDWPAAEVRDGDSCADVYEVADRQHLLDCIAEDATR